MQEQVIVMSADQYFEKYAVKGIGNGADRWMIKRQLVDAFRKEIFGLVALRAKKDLNDIPEGDVETMKIAKHVIHDEALKWKKLCHMFSNYVETKDLLYPDDLKLYDEIADIGKTSEEVNEELGNTEEEPIVVNGGLEVGEEIPQVTDEDTSTH